MKKLRIVLSTLAFLTVISAVMATQLNSSTSVDGYEMIEGACTFTSNICDTNGTYACKVDEGAPVLKEFVNATSCGEELSRLTPPPAH